jgi:hypothetical protein
MNSLRTNSFLYLGNVRHRLSQTDLWNLAARLEATPFQNEPTPAASYLESFTDGPANWNRPVPAVHGEMALSTIGGESHGLMVRGVGLAKLG